MSAFRRTCAAAWPPTLVYLLLVTGIFVGGHVIGAPKHDQDLYHHLTVIEFSRQWPVFDLTDYGSATSPLYHILMASLVSWGASDLDTLRLFSSLFGLGLVVTVAGWAAVIVPVRTAAFLTMPLAASIYVVGSGVHVHTDNLGWFLVMLALGPLVFMPPRTDRWCLVGLLVLLAVAVRQVMVWALGPLVLAGLLRSPLQRMLGTALDSGKVGPTGRSWTPLLVALLVSIPSILLLAWFFVLWGGLVPPRFQEVHESALSWCAPAYGLAVFAIYAPFFLGLVQDPLELFRRHRTLLVLGALLGGLLALAFPSGYSIEDGRFGGPVWMLVSKGPVVGGRSLLLASMAAFGAASLLLIVLALIRVGRGLPALLLACSWCATHSTQLVNAQTFQRYFDTPTLVIMAWFGALMLVDRPDADRRSALGPPLLTLVLGMLLVLEVLGT